MTSQPPVREGAQPRRLPAQHWTTDLHATPFVQPRSTDKRPSGAPSSPGSPASPSTSPSCLPTSARFEFGPSWALRSPSPPPHPPNPPRPREKVPTNSLPTPKHGKNSEKRASPSWGDVLSTGQHDPAPSSSWLAKPAGGPRDLRSTSLMGLVAIGASRCGKYRGGGGGQGRQAQGRGALMRASSFKSSQDYSV